MTHNPYSVTPRKPLSSKQLLQLFIAKDGKCCLCGFKIDGVKEAWDEHVIPLADGGGNEMSNRDVAHERCARQKTSGEAESRAHLRSAAERHFGAHRPKGRPMAGTKRSRFKKHVDGSVSIRGER